MSSTISDEICKKLAADIISGVISPGQKLEEKAIAEQFKVSRTPVRDAFRQLEGTGLIETKAHRGTTVIDLNTEQLADIFEALGEIEALCAKLSAQRMSTMERKRLENLHERSKAPSDSRDEDQYSDLNEQIHRAIHDGAQNETLRALSADLWQRLAPFRRTFFFRRDNRMARSHDEHDEVIEAILAGDTETAFTAMRNHVANSSLNALTYLEENRNNGR
jgi:DNA-binding GntR family transcriptional regulator